MVRTTEQLLTGDKALIKLFIFFLVLFISLWASVREIGLFPDTGSYYVWVEEICLGNEIRAEYSFLLLAKVACFLPNDYPVKFLFFIYFFLSLIILSTAFERMNSSIIVWCLSYFFAVAIYMNFIQIRFGLGIAFLMLGLTYMDKQRRVAFLCFIAASLSHYFFISTLPLFLIVFVDSRLFFIVLPLVGIFVSSIFDFAIASVLNIRDVFSSSEIFGYILDKVDYYRQRSYQEFNLFNFYSIFSIGAFILCALFPKHFLHNNNAVIFWKALSVYLFAFFASEAIPIFSRRISFIICCIAIFILSQRSIARTLGGVGLVVIFLSILQFINLVFRHGLVRVF